MGLDRRKHDVDIIERVLGGVRDPDTTEVRARVVDVDVPWVSGLRDQTLELTVGIDEADHRRPKG
jgi:hypothetical protein